MTSDNLNELDDTVLIEVVFPGQTLSNAGFSGRDELEVPLDDALSSAGIGEVTGGGGGEDGSIINVEIWEKADVTKAIVTIRDLLRKLRAPEETLMIERGTETRVHRLSDRQLPTSKARRKPG